MRATPLLFLALPAFLFALGTTASAQEDCFDPNPQNGWADPAQTGLSAVNFQGCS